MPKSHLTLLVTDRGEARGLFPLRDLHLVRAECGARECVLQMLAVTAGAADVLADEMMGMGVAVEDCDMRPEPVPDRKPKRRKAKGAAG